MKHKTHVEKTVRDIRRRTCNKYSAENEYPYHIGSLGEAALPGCAAMKASMQCLSALLEGVAGGGQHRLTGDTVREANTDTVKRLHAAIAALKEVLVDVIMGNRLLKKA